MDERAGDEEQKKLKDLTTNSPEVSDFYGYNTYDFRRPTEDLCITGLDSKRSV